MREWVEKELTPFAHEWDEAGFLPPEIRKKAAFWLPSVIGYWPKEYLGNAQVIGGLKPEEFDAFHGLVLLDEVSRCGSGGVVWGILGGLSIGAGPVFRFGAKHLREKVAPCLTGEKVICLCVTEPTAGSDVMNVQTKAEKTADGKFYIVNGEKKWITNGIYADYFTVAVRTGSGPNGISLLLLERGMPGLKTRKMNVGGVWCRLV